MKSLLTNPWIEEGIENGKEKRNTGGFPYAQSLRSRYYRIS
jgi:hypothetical protein